MSQLQLPMIILGFGLGYFLAFLIVESFDKFNDWRIDRKNERYFEECRRKGISPYPPMLRLDTNLYFNTEPKTKCDHWPSAVRILSYEEYANYRKLYSECPKCGEKL